MLVRVSLGFLTLTLTLARNVAWVGFQDSFEESICLLHKRFGPFPVHPLELVNMRKGARNNTEITDRIGVAVREVLAKTDHLMVDDLLVQCARERFEREVKHYGCGSYSNGLEHKDTTRKS
jgi:hypothetical protein